MADSATRVAAQDADAKPRSARGMLLSLLAIVVLLGAAAWGFYCVTVASKYVATDNAYVGAETAQITPLVSAPVAQVLVRETQQKPDALVCCHHGARYRPDTGECF